MSTVERGQIRFFKKSRLDLSNDLASITITDAVATNNGQTFVDFMRNRNNVSAWMTTGSTDAALTTIETNFTDERDIDSIMILCHNLADYTVKYWDGASFVDFAVPIAVTANTSINSFHKVTKVTTSRIQIIIQGTMVADDDKKIKQLIMTESLVTGQFEGWPIIKNPRHSTNRKVSNMLSGKVNVVESVGAFSCDLSVANWSKDSDLNIVEEIYLGKRGVLVWLSGGDDSQFLFRRFGYREEDIYFMRAINDYSPTWRSGVYVNGVKINLKLKEAVV